MKSSLFILLIMLFSCQKIGIGKKHCYECTTVTNNPQYHKVVEQCGTDKQIDDFERQGYSFRTSVNGTITSDVTVPFACVQKD